MADINDYILHPEDQDKTPERLDRERVLSGWNRELARRIASDENLQLSDEHWALIEYLRKDFLENGSPHNSHELTQKLEAEFAKSGGIRQLYLLFPDGPIAQGSRIAGLPIPHDAEDESFGSVQ